MPERLKLVIPSYDRPQRIFAHLTLPRKYYKPIVVLHNDAQADAYIKAGLDKKLIVVSNLPKGIARTRNFILDELIDSGEWYASADDKVHRTFIVPQPFYASGKLPEDPRAQAQAFKTVATPERFHEVIQEMLQLGERSNSLLCGFSTTDNYFFRKRKFRPVGLVVGKFFLNRKTDLRFDENAETVEDFDFSAAHIMAFGRVLINNFVFAEGKHYLPGGLGPLKDRIALKRKSVAHISEKFPGLIGPHPTRGDAELRFRLHSIKQVMAWREQMTKL